ncbi:MAG: alpha/beta fold hydrolase [Rhodospirillales bacterium]|nr:alpha/beta fold hydrolase [Rhodospirillales bacterium]
MRSKSGETAYDISGDGPPVALVHGLGLNRGMWRWQLPALTPRFTVISYDLLGHGESAKPQGQCDLSLFADQLARLLDEIGVARCAVVGFSLGGMIARAFALAHPQRLSALVVFNSAHDRSEAERDAVRERVEQVRESGPAATVEAALERWFTPGCAARDPETMALIRRWIMANDPAVYPEIYRVLAEGDRELAQAIGAIACPTLVMTGEEDQGNTPDMARRMAERIPGARVEILPGLRHMGLAEAPERFNGPLVAFLEAALSSSGDTRGGGGTTT